MSALRAIASILLVVSPGLAATFGTVVPHAQPLADLVVDESGRRLFVVNTASNQVEVYSTVGLNAHSKAAATIKTEATPLALAFPATASRSSSPATTLPH